MIAAFTVQDEIAELVRQSAYRTRIEFLLQNSELGRQRLLNGEDIKSNCHGTTLHVIGRQLPSEPERLHKKFFLTCPSRIPNHPGYCDNNVMSSILNLRQARTEPIKDGIIALWNEGAILHTGIYLGYKDRHVLFHQYNYGGDFEISTIEEYAGLHSPRINTIFNWYDTSEVISVPVSSRFAIPLI